MPKKCGLEAYPSKGLDSSPVALEPELDARGAPVKEKAVIAVTARSQCAATDVKMRNGNLSAATSLQRFVSMGNSHSVRRPTESADLLRVRCQLRHHVVANAHIMMQNATVFAV